MGVVSNRRRHRRRWRQIAGLHEDGMPKFSASCSDVVALARAKIFMSMCSTWVLHT